MSVWHKDLLNSPTTVLEWAEPWPGLDADGVKRDAHVVFAATVAECIRMQRFRNAQKRLSPRPDSDLLDEFIVINWAAPRKATS